MKKRILALSLAAAMVVGALASCTATAEPAGSNASVEARDITLTLWGSEADQAFLKEVSAAWADQYASSHDDVKSATVTVQIKDEDKAKGDALNDIDAAADVFGVPNDAVGDLVGANAIYKMPDSVVSEIKAVASDDTFAATYYDGANYGFPYTTNTAEILFYNKSLIDDEEAKSLNAILDKNIPGVTNLIVDFDSGWNGMTWFATAGADLYTDGDTSINTLNKPEVKTMLEWLQTQFKAGKMVDTNSDGDAAALLKDGKAAALFYGSWAKGSFKDALGDNFGVAELPSVTVDGVCTDEHLKCFGGNKMLVINAVTKEPEAALDLARYITSEDNQLKKFESVGQLPAAKSLASNSTVTADPSIAAEINQGSYVINSQSAVGTSGWWSEQPAVMADVMNSVVTGDAIQEKLDTLVETMQTNVGA